MRIIILLLAFIMFRPIDEAVAQVNPEEAFERSYMAEADSNFTKAIELLQSVYDADSYLVNMRLGWLHYLNGEPMKSIKYYEKSMSLMPYAIEPKLGYVYPLSALGNWERVISIYKEILKIDPQHALVNYRLGLIYYNQGRYEEAFPFVERVANLYPFDYHSIVLLGWIHKQMGHTREAQVLFEKALLIKPGDESAMEGLGR